MRYYRSSSDAAPSPAKPVAELVEVQSSVAGGTFGSVGKRRREYGDRSVVGAAALAFRGAHRLDLLGGHFGPRSASILPGAEGFGGTFTGTAPAGGWFSNATVYHVTTTVDDLGSDGKGAPGTLRGAFRENTANKIIVFDVGGTITLNDNLDIKNVQNYYIAGQTAPSPVTVYGNIDKYHAQQ